MDLSDQKEKLKAFIADTNVMMHDPNALKAFGNNIVIVPIYALQELDKHKNDPGVCGANCRTVSRFLKDCTQNADPTKGVDIGNGGRLYIDYNGLDFSKLPVGLEQNNDARMILVAMKWRDDPPVPVDEVWLISKDTNLVITARVCGINADDYMHDKLIKSADELYSGFSHIELPGSLYSTLDLANAHKDGVLIANVLDNFVDLQELLPNTCCLLDIEGKTFPAIYKKEGGLFRLIKRTPNPSSRQEKRKEVRPKNLEQIFALALLTDPDISLVTLIGKAGTGKTLMALLAAWEQINNPFKQILVYRPNVPMGRDLGFLPGDLKEKFEPYTWPILDNMSLIIGETDRELKKERLRNKHGSNPDQESEKPEHMSLRDLFEYNMLRIDPTTFIRGRSVNRSVLIVDEAQNLTPHEIKTTVTRAGQQTKVVLTGDIFQIDNPYVDLISNGLTHATQRFKGNKRFGHITMFKGERSELAELAADLL